MKHLFCFLIVFVILSCTIDSYDKGDGELSAVQADFVMAHAVADHKVDYAVTDDNQRLTLQSLYAASWAQKADSSYRAIMYYEKKGEEAAVVSLTQIPVVALIPKDSLKSDMKTDPLTFESIWVSKNKSYVNVSFYAKIGTTDKEKAVHRMGIIKDTLLTNADNKKTLCLRFYHDQGDVPEYYSQKGYFSIPLKGLTADSIRLTMNTYKGEVIKTVAIK